MTVDSTKNRITSMGSFTFVYDASGNLTQDDLYKYVYDAENCLVQVQTLAGALVASYAIDGHRLRVAKVVGTTRTFYIYSETQLISEFSDAASTTYTTGTTPKQAPADSASLLLYHHSDHLTARLATDNSGNVGNAHGHYPFGESWYDMGPTSSTVARKFTTYMQDTETSTGQLHYAVFREHSARLGRFQMPDPLQNRAAQPALALNRYTYVADDPINRTDPQGLQFEFELHLILGSGVGIGGVREKFADLLDFVFDLLQISAPQVTCDQPNPRLTETACTVLPPLRIFRTCYYLIECGLFSPGVTVMSFPAMAAACNVPISQVKCPQPPKDIQIFARLSFFGAIAKVVRDNVQSSAFR